MGSGTAASRSTRLQCYTGAVLAGLAFPPLADPMFLAPPGCQLMWQHPTHPCLVPGLQATLD